jgi:hypothetical protein
VLIETLPQELVHLFNSAGFRPPSYRPGDCIVSGRLSL